MAKRRTVRIDIGVIQITPCTLLCIFLFGYVLHFIGFFSPFWVVEGCHEKGLFYSCSDCLLLNNTRIKGCFIHNGTCKYMLYMYMFLKNTHFDGDSPFLWKHVLITEDYVKIYFLFALSDFKLYILPHTWTEQSTCMLALL